MPPARSNLNGFDTREIIDVFSFPNFPVPGELEEAVGLGPGPMGVVGESIILPIGRPLLGLQGGDVDTLPAELSADDRLEEARLMFLGFR